MKVALNGVCWSSLIDRPADCRAGGSHAIDLMVHSQRRPTGSYLCFGEAVLTGGPQRAVVLQSAPGQRALQMVEGLKRIWWKSDAALT
jgi:hypothetical protein